MQASQHTASNKEIPASSPTDGELYMTAENVGDQNVKGEGAHVKMTDVLPPGLEALGVAGSEPFKEGNFKAREPIPCSLEEKGGVQSASCTLSKALAPYDQIEMRINVKLKAGAHTGELNQLSVSGGGAPPKLIERPITVSEAPVPFGVESYEMGLEEEGGATTTQAGAHPFQLNTTIALNQLKDINPLEAPPEHRPEVTPAGLAKDLNFKLPAGFVGNATVLPQCTTAQFFETVAGQENRCPPDSAVGVATTTVHEPATVGTSTLTEPIFNLAPRKGEPARFGFYVVLANSPVFIDTSVRTGSDYGVNVSVQNITQTGAFLSSEVTFWGTPADPRHDNQRGWGCIYGARGGSSAQPCTPSEEQHPRPLLSLPSSCSRTLSTSVEGDSWADPGSFFDFTKADGAVFEPEGPLVGCNRLSFGPQLKVTSENEEAAHPSGMTIDVHLPQEANQNASGLASSNIRSTTITFPQGFSVNPSSADGLEACAEGEVGFQNARGAEEELLFSPDLPQPFCPDAAKVGSVRIKTPLLPAGQYLQEGGLYLATPAPNGEGSKNPFNSLIALYLVVKDPISGVLLKLPGQVSLDPATGQVSTSFQNTPDINAEDIEVSLTAGPRAPLASPAGCGTYPVNASFTPWSGTAPVSSSATLRVSSGPGGSPCPSSPLPFAPSLAAGTSNVNAGAFTPLSTSINREDANQQIGSVSVHTPPGLSGVLSGVSLCTNEQADAGACPANSLIGHSSVSVGFGSDPFTVTNGQVFLTESYERRALRPVDPHPGARRPLQPRQRRRARKAPGRPLHDRADRHDRRIGPLRDPPHPRRDPARDPPRQRHDRPPGLHLQPDQLRPAEPHRHGQGPGRRKRSALGALPGGELPDAQVRPQILGLGLGQGNESKRHRPLGQAELPERPAWHLREPRQGQSQPAKAAAKPPEHAEQGLRRAGLRSKPRSLPQGIARRAGEGAHPASADPAERHRLLRLPRRRSLPGPDDGPERLGRLPDQSDPDRQHPDQEGGDDDDLQGDPRRPLLEL